MKPAKRIATLLAAVIFLPFTLMFWAIITIRNYFYDTGILRVHKTPVKLVSVGNISVGGTGKTPMAELLIQSLVDRNKRVAYLSRGYGRKTKGFMHVDSQQHTVAQVGDEALQVALRFPNVPVAVCEDRVAGVNQLLAQHKLDIIVLDDAFQHRRLFRDRDIVMIDGTRLPWRDMLLPFGRLREPVAGLRRADMAVVTRLPKSKEGRNKRIIRKRLSAPVVFADAQARQLVSVHNPADTLPNNPNSPLVCVAFSGLGNNEQFVNSLKSSSFQVYDFLSFPDHHQYTTRDLERVKHAYKAVLKLKLLSTHKPIIVTTSKDYMRLRNNTELLNILAELPVYFLDIRLEITEGRRKFEDFVASLASNPATPHQLLTQPATLEDEPAAIPTSIAHDTPALQRNAPVHTEAV